MSGFNFFELQEHARQNTRVLVIAIVMAVVVVVGTIDFFLLHWMRDFDFWDMLLSPLTFLILALLGAVVLEEKGGRSLLTTVLIALIAAAVLFEMPSAGHLRGVSGQFYLWRVYDFAAAPQNMLVWLALVWIFVRDRGSLCRNLVLTLALLPAAIALRLAINMTISVGLMAPNMRLPLATAFAIVAFYSLIPLAIIGVVSLRRMQELRAGGSAVAQSLQAKPLEDSPADPALRQLHNVVAEMAIAAGIPAPQIYLLEQPEINALAAGWSANDAALIVTRGAVDQLTREEIQAVVAHEFAHIVNDDIRLDIRLMGLLAGLTAIDGIGRKLIKSLVRKVPYPVGIPLTIVGAMVLSVGYLGALLADMIRAGVSHSREYLADACAVQFTRQIDGLRGALRKIAAQGRGAGFAGADQVGHMLFAETQSSPLFRTHPPAELRVLAIDPRGLEGPSPELIEPGSAVDEGEATEPSVDRSAPIEFVLPGSALPIAAQPLNEPPAAAPRPAPATVVRAPARSAAGGHRVPPPEALELAHQAETAPAAILALLLGSDIRAKAAQLKLIQTECGEAVARQVLAVSGVIQKLQLMQRMPLALASAAALKRRPREELARLKSAIHALVHADAQVTVFEYALGVMIEAQLREALEPLSAREPRLRLDTAENEIVLALSVFAQAGHAGETEAARAFQRGLSQVLPKTAVKYRAQAGWHVKLDAALARLDHLSPIAKEMLLEGFVATLMHDSTVTVDEYELLRAVCTRLHCQPPALPNVA